jgi:hypothetical protein
VTLKSSFVREGDSFYNDSVYDHRFLIKAIGYFRAGVEYNDDFAGQTTASLTNSKAINGPRD